MAPNAESAAPAPPQAVQPAAQQVPPPPAAAAAVPQAERPTEIPPSPEPALPMPSPEEWSRQVQASVDLVPKLANILRSRGMGPPDTTADFTAVEEYLGTALPADYKALISALPPPNVAPTAWGLDPFYLFAADEMLQELQQLRAVCHARASYNGISMKQEDPVSFVPLGNSTSAFYVGWVKTQSSQHAADYNVRPWELVVFDSKNHFDYEPGEGMYRPLVETLYRMVVRAVPPAVWAQRGGCGRASYFWHSEDESDEADLGITRYARDGSQDHAASHATRIVVLGRPVCFLGGSDPDEPRCQDTSHLERKSCFDRCSEADFQGVGEYNVEHPIDVQVEKKQKRLREAPRENAMISLDSSQTVKVERWQLVTSGKDEFRKALHQATVLRRRIAVGDRWSAFIGKNGQLAMVDNANQYLWWNVKANNMLDDKEIFTQLDMSGRHAVVLTSKGRILTIRGFHPSYTWRCFEKLSKETNFSMKVVKVSAGDNAAAALTNEGRIIYWGSVSSHKGGKTHTTVQEPFFVPNLSRIVDINLMGRGLCILHSSGRVSLITKKDGLRIIDSSHKVVAVHATGDHVLMLNAKGEMHGLGDREKGQLPLAVTKQTIQEYNEAQTKYERDVETFAEKLTAFRKTILEHAASCPKFKDKKVSPTPDDDAWSPRLHHGVYTNISQVLYVHGTKLTPDNCGAPALPHELKTSPRPPVDPRDQGGDAPLKDPTLLTVGKAHKDALESDQTIKLSKQAWNAVTGAYGCTPGSTSLVAAVSGMSSCTVFLHTDGTLSACGDGKPLCTGLVPPGAERNNSKYTGRKWGAIGIPLAVKPYLAEGEEAPKFAAVAVGKAGVIAVDESGQIWGCGDSIGTPESTELLEKLIVLR